MGGDGHHSVLVLCAVFGGIQAVTESTVGVVVGIRGRGTNGSGGWHREGMYPNSMES